MQANLPPTTMTDPITCPNSALEVRPLKRMRHVSLLLLPAVGFGPFLLNPSGSSAAPIPTAAESQQQPPPGAPVFELGPSWPALPDQWVLGEVSSIGVDSQNRLLVLHRPRSVPADERHMAAPPVLEFDVEGNFLRAWGGAGDGFEWPEREHAIHVDHQDNIWIGGNNCPERNLPELKPVGDDQIVKFSRGGQFLMQIGRSDQSGGNGDTRNVRQPGDQAVYAETNEVFVADGYGNRRLIVFDADTGEFKRMWGAFGNEPVDSYGCPPPTFRLRVTATVLRNSTLCMLSPFQMTGSYTRPIGNTDAYRSSPSEANSSIRYSCRITPGRAT